MSYGDYQHCKVCDGRTFYDSDVCWENARVAFKDGNPASVVSLCEECFVTHEIVVRKRGMEVSS